MISSRFQPGSLNLIDPMRVFSRAPSQPLLLLFKVSGRICTDKNQTFGGYEKSYQMKKATPSYPSLLGLIAGDLIVLALVTVIGFASHDELGAGVPRYLATFVPLLIAWLLVAPFLGAYDSNKVTEVRQLWRPFWAMILAGPMMGLLRALLLGTVVIPAFVIVVGGISALALLVWRFVYSIISQRTAARKSQAHGRS